MFSNLQDLHPDIPISNLVDVTASSYQDESGVCQSLGWSKPVSIIEKHKTRGWYNTAQSYEAWIAFDITKVSYLNNFYIIGYQIEPHYNCCIPKGWDFQGRNSDAESWNTISSIENTNKFQSEGPVNFPSKRSFYKQYRLNFKETDCYKGTQKFYLGIKAFDLLLTKPETCQHKVPLKTFVMISLFTLVS